MAFRQANILAHTMKFNSANSSDFIDLYESTIDSEIKSGSEGVKHKTFAPSSFRCSRLNWFRLRGVETDFEEKSIDRSLQFTADMGTACHELIQGRLSSKLQNDWLDVKNLIEAKHLDYEYDVTTKGYESLIEIRKPYPVRFAVDGVINFKGQIYLLEIKSSDFSSFQDLTEPKQKHVDQIKCYCSLLDISHVMVLYIDRQYGGLKCFELTVSESERQAVRSKMDYILNCVDSNIAPDGLPKGDPWCSPSMCPYSKKCKEW